MVGRYKIVITLALMALPIFVSSNSFAQDFVCAEIVPCNPDGSVYEQFANSPCNYELKCANLKKLQEVATCQGKLDDSYSENSSLKRGMEYLQAQLDEKDALVKRLKRTLRVRTHRNKN